MNWLRLFGRKGCLVGISVAIVLTAVLVSPAGATVYCIEKDVELYGNLKQTDVPGIGACACGPTAAVNSFVYLENAYPGIYDNSLVPAGSAGGNDYNGDGVSDAYDDMAAIAKKISRLAYMNCVCPGGTYDDMFIYGKQKYMEEVAPNKTIYGAQLSSTWAWPGGRLEGEYPPIDKPDWVEDNTIPRWQFLYDNLVDCEDVEILIVDGDWGHYLTLTSFCWDDVDEDQIIDSDEGAIIDYIDPATGAWGVSGIWQTSLDGQLYVPYGVYTAQLVMAMKESPVPEPAAVVLLCTGGLCLLGYWRRRKRTA